MCEEYFTQTQEETERNLPIVMPVSIWFPNRQYHFSLDFQKRSVFDSENANCFYKLFPFGHVRRLARVLRRSARAQPP